MTDEEAFAKFIEEWKKIPPLGRAAFASGLIVEQQQIAEGCMSNAMLMGQMKLARRAAVGLRLSLMHSAFRDLLIELAHNADAEASAANVDLFVTGAEEDDLVQRAQEALDKHRPDRAQFGLATSIWRTVGEEPPK